MNTKAHDDELREDLELLSQCNEMVCALSDSFSTTTVPVYKPMVPILMLVWGRRAGYYSAKILASILCSDTEWMFIPFRVEEMMNRFVVASMKQLARETGALDS